MHAHTHITIIHAYINLLSAKFHEVRPSQYTHNFQRKIPQYQHFPSFSSQICMHISDMQMISSELLIVMAKNTSLNTGINWWNLDLNTVNYENILVYIDNSDELGFKHTIILINAVPLFLCSLAMVSVTEASLRMAYSLAR